MFRNVSTSGLSGIRQTTCYVLSALFIQKLFLGSAICAGAATKFSAAAPRRQGGKQQSFGISDTSSDGGDPELDLFGSGAGGVDSDQDREGNGNIALHVGNLDPRLTELDMATAFEQYGTVVDLSMPTDRKTGENKGYCFLQYQDSRSCDLAFNNMKGVEIASRRLRLDVRTDYKTAKEREKELFEKQKRDILMGKGPRRRDVMP